MKKFTIFTYIRNVIRWFGLKWVFFSGRRFSLADCVGDGRLSPLSIGVVKTSGNACDLFWLIRIFCPSEAAEHVTQVIVTSFRTDRLSQTNRGQESRQPTTFKRQSTCKLPIMQHSAWRPVYLQCFFIKSENQMLWAQNWLITNIIWFLLCNSHFHSKYCFVFEPMKDVDFLSGTVTQKQQITQMYHSTSWKLLRDLKLLLAYFSVISIVFNIQKSCCQNVHYSSFFILIRFRI